MSTRETPVLACHVDGIPATKGSYKPARAQPVHERRPDHRRTRHGGTAMSTRETPVLACHVDGIPATKGSYKPVRNRRTGKTLLVGMNRHEHEWRNRPSMSADQIIDGHGTEERP